MAVNHHGRKSSWQTTITVVILDLQLESRLTRRSPGTNFLLLEGFFCCHGSSFLLPKGLIPQFAQMMWMWTVHFPACTASGVFLFLDPQSSTCGKSPFVGLWASTGSSYSTPCHL